MAPYRSDGPQTLGDLLARMKPLPAPPPWAPDEDHARTQRHNDALDQLQTSARVAHALAQDAVTRGGRVPDSLLHLVPSDLLGQVVGTHGGTSGVQWPEQSPIGSSDDATDPWPAKSAYAVQASSNSDSIPSSEASFSPNETPQPNSATAFDPRLDLLGKVWASPYTALGLAYGGLGHLYGLATGQHPEISFGNDAVQFINNPFVNKTSAFTLGNAILYGAEQPPERPGAYGDLSVKNVGKHEQAHTYQYQALGPLFGPAYMLAGGFSGPTDPSGRPGNVFEDAAQRYGSGQGSWWPW